MDIKSIRLKNFKGFRDATLILKPLTVLLGPNSSGKSCFGQALVALSKSNAKNEIPSLAFDQESTVEFGGYADLVHQGSEEQPVIIGLEFDSDKVELGFGPGNTRAGIKELELSEFRVHPKASAPLPESVSQVITTTFSEADSMNQQKVKIFDRVTLKEWKVLDGAVPERLNLIFNGMSIEAVSNPSWTPNAPPIPIDDKVVPRNRLEHLSSLLRGISYLRPDREAPLRKKIIPSSGANNIDDRGVGTDLFIHKNRLVPVETFFFPEPSISKDENIAMLRDYSKLEQGEKPLLDALTLWLKNLGLVSFLDIQLLDDGRAIQSVATPVGQHRPRPLTDIGFGVSQVLPILVKGLTIKGGDLLVVEQPEAQLHPRPQAVLADFFCAMVKCGRNVIVETHSEELFHRLRLRASMDDDLAANIGVYFLNEPANGECCEPIPISLNEDAELKWPQGFLPDALGTEMAIRAARRAKPAKE